MVLPANALDDWYVTGFGGGQIVDKIDVFHADRFDVSAFSANCAGPVVCPLPIFDAVKTADMEFHPGFLIGGSIGASVLSNLRVELELAASRNEIDVVGVDGLPSNSFIFGGNGVDHRVAGQLDAYTVLMNGWFDLPTGTTVRPYLGGGVGIGIVDVNATWGSRALGTRTFVASVAGPVVNGYHFTGVGFAFQAGAGVRVPVNDTLIIDLGYRYRGIEGIKFKADVAKLVDAKPHIGSHVVMLGLSWQLP